MKVMSDEWVWLSLVDHWAYVIKMHSKCTQQNWGADLAKMHSRKVRCIFNWVMNEDVPEMTSHVNFFCHFWVQISYWPEWTWFALLCVCMHALRYLVGPTAAWYWGVKYVVLGYCSYSMYIDLPNKTVGLSGMPHHYWCSRTCLLEVTWACCGFVIRVIRSRSQGSIKYTEVMPLWHKWPNDQDLCACFTAQVATHT